MFEYEVSGKSISKAIDKGLAELNVAKEDVDIKILQNASFLTKARVLIVVRDEVVETNETIKNMKKIQELEAQIALEEQKITACTQEKNGILNQISTSIMLKNGEIPAEVDVVKMFLSGFLSSANYSAEVEVVENDHEISAQITGENLGKLLKSQGEALNSLQFLTNVFARKFNRKAKKVVVDVNGFKKKRRETLEALAHRLAKRVVETGSKVELEPMNSFERLIMHNVIALYPDLISESVGEAPNRYLTIRVRN